MASLASFNPREGNKNELGSYRRKLEAIAGQFQQQWGKLTDDHLDVIAGKREQLAGKIQEIYGRTKEDVEKQISDWQIRQESQPHRQDKRA